MYTVSEKNTSNLAKAVNLLDFVVNKQGHGLQNLAGSWLKGGKSKRTQDGGVLVVWIRELRGN